MQCYSHTKGKKNICLWFCFCSNFCLFSQLYILIALLHAWKGTEGFVFLRKKRNITDHSCLLLFSPKCLSLSSVTGFLHSLPFNQTHCHTLNYTAEIAMGLDEKKKLMKTSVAKHKSHNCSCVCVCVSTLAQLCLKKCVKPPVFGMSAMNDVCCHQR